MRRPRRLLLPIATAVAVGLGALPALAQPAAAATNYVTNCAVNLRTGPKTSARIRATIDKDTTVSASGSVTGGSWKADCGSNVSGTVWFKIVAVNGRSVSSLYGVSVLYAAKGLFRNAPTPKSDFLANCGVNLRTSASTSARIRTVIGKNSLVTASATVSGSSWKADCGSTVKGTSWLKIVAVNGKSVSSLYGVGALYAAKGLFRSISSSGYLEGIDVSNWQGTIDWAKVRGAGKRFVIAKATEGVGFKDPSYERNKSGAMAQGIAFGAYHFARPENDPVREADWFVSASGYKRGMLIPTLDLERTGGRGPTGLTNWTKAWLKRVHDRLGVRPMIYTSPSFWRQNLDDTRWFADNGYAVLWVAHWGTTSPSVPASNWGGRSWTFWQYSSNGSVSGISGRVDLDRYRYSNLSAVTY
jgi:GH25 family lysozyme M1 (1,4-beta-N-acetylmuramidase)